MLLIFSDDFFCACNFLKVGMPSRIIFSSLSSLFGFFSTFLLISVYRSFLRKACLLPHYQPFHQLILQTCYSLSIFCQSLTFGPRSCSWRAPIHPYFRFQILHVTNITLNKHRKSLTSSSPTFSLTSVPYRKLFKNLHETLLNCFQRPNNTKNTIKPNKKELTLASEMDQMKKLRFGYSRSISKSTFLIHYNQFSVLNMSHYQYYHDCLYNCISNCCNQFGTCPQDYVNTIFANEKRYTQCYEHGAAHEVTQTYPLVDSSIYMAILIAVVLLLAIVSIINLVRYMSRLLKNKSQANPNTNTIDEGEILEKRAKSIENACYNPQTGQAKFESRLIGESVDEQRKTLEI